VTTHEGILRQPTLPQADATATPEQSFEALVAAEYGQVRGLAWRFGVPKAELDDAAQEVFTKAWAAWNGFRGTSAPASWLIRIAVNHLTSRRRRLVRRLQVWRTRQPADEAVTTGASPELREAHARALQCVEALPPKLRGVFVLRYLEEMSCREVAETLELPETTVRTRLLRARKKLREMMEGYQPWNP
jgi:RNA polymerase sigma-70 factor (ECF subfamily)